jgi:hypothetical protein
LHFPFSDPTDQVQNSQRYAIQVKKGYSLEQIPTTSLKEPQKSNHGPLDKRERERVNSTYLTMVSWIREGGMEKSNHGSLDERKRDGEI